ncbi:LysR family transcriptional regulator [Corallococcus exercitus]|uniref:LysR family transcriptional regulator n=1 Tax=Corallococcus exercitus TaxID=2316736 RepID=UPI0035D4BD3E
MRFFVELARAGSLSSAARSLQVSHATVGRRVAALEEALGCTLFNRRADGYTLTAEGAAVLESAADMEERALAIQRRAGQGGSLTGTVRLTAVEGLAERLLIPRVAGFRSQHPGIDLEVIEDSRSLSLARREADVAIRLARPRSGELFARRLSTLGYGVYAAPRGDTSAWVGYDDSFAHLPESQWLARHAAGARMALRANGLMVQLAAVRAGFGKALLPCWFAEQERGLVRLPPPAPLPEREVWLVVHRDLREVPRVRALIDAVVAIFEAERERLGPRGT